MSRIFDHTLGESAAVARAAEMLWSTASTWPTQRSLGSATPGVTVVPQRVPARLNRCARVFRRLERRYLTGAYVGAHRDKY